MRRHRISNPLGEPSILEHPATPLRHAGGACAAQRLPRDLDLGAVAASRARWQRCEQAFPLVRRTGHDGARLDDSALQNGAHRPTN
jgi:hypothetical protein